MTATPSKAELKKNLKQLQERLADRPMDLDARMRVARTYRLLHKADEAVRHYAAVARYLSLAGHPLQAIAVLKELLQVDPKHEETLLFLAKLYARTRAADASNRGRIAIPILEPGQPISTLEGGIPLTTTGIWRAIAPAQPESLAVVKSADDLGASVDTSGPVAKPASSSSSSSSAEQPVSEADVVESFDDEEATKQDDTKALAHFTADAAVDKSEADDSSPPVPDIDLGDDYEVLGHLSTGDVLLPQVPLFSSLSPEAFVHLSHAMVFLKKKAGDVVFEEGQPGDSCIVVARGRARVSRKDRASPNSSGAEIEILQLGEGDIAGVFALMSAQTRQASLTAITDLEYFEIDRIAIDELIDKYPAMKASLHRFFRERLILSMLGSLPFFLTLDARERQDLMRRFVDREYEPGDELFFEGAEHDGLWVVLEGKVAVQKEATKVEKTTGAASANHGGPKRLVLSAGDYVGSLARVDGGAADLGAVATTVATCAVLPHKAFSELLEKHAAKHEDVERMRARFKDAGIMVGEHVFAGNGTLSGHLVPPTRSVDHA